MVAFEIRKSSKVPPRTKFYGALGSNLRPSLYGGHEVTRNNLPCSQDQTANREARNG